MQTSSRRLLATSIAAALALGLSACGLNPAETETRAPADPATGDATSAAASGELSGEITYQTWSLKNEKFTPYFEKLVADFEAEHPGTKINWVDQPGDGYEDKIMQQVTAGDLPDVVNIPQGMAYQLAKAGKVVDLRKADPEAIELYTDGGISAYEYDDVEGTYGYPWYLGTDLNWWNTAAFDEYGLDKDKLPSTMDELFAAAETMAEKSNGQMPLLSSPPALADLAAADVELFKDGKFVFNTDEGVAVLQRYVDLYQKKAMPPEVLADSYLGNSELFMQGKVAWTTGSASFPVNLAENNPTIAESAVASPRIGTPPLFVQGVSVAAESDNPELALAFAQYSTNNENQVEFVKLAQGFLPGTKEGNENPDSFTSVIEDPKMKEAADMLAEQMQTAQIQEPVQYTDAMKTYVGQQFTSAMRGDITAKEALDAAVKYCNDNIA